VVRPRRVTAAILGLATLALAIAVADVPVGALTHDLSADSVPTFAMVLALIASGAIIARHQPRNPIGWLLLAAAVFFALNGLASDYSVLDYRLRHGALALGALAVVAQPAWAPAIVCFALSILLFPDGRLPPGLWRWALWGFLLIGVVWLAGAFSIALSAIASHAVHVDPSGDLVAIDNPRGGNAWWGYVQDAFFPALALSAFAWLGRQLVALHAARGAERLQLKWFTGGAALSVLGGFASVLGDTVGGGSVVRVATSILGVGLVAFPISIGVAVSRYRLYEIDRLVSRTLAYAILTALLVGTFIGLVALSTDILAISGRVGVAASTLAAAALFNPLRVRIQRLVDRRFNRARYDADAIVSSFTARLRDAVELDAIRSDLLDAVHTAVQPSHASIWIKH
jgi:MFS family permease